MKKLIIVIVVLAIPVGGYLYVKNYVRAPLTIIMGKTVKAHRGDLIVPITASGHIRPASVTNIKSKASGEVIKLPFEIGKYVKKGDLVVQLDETDESRNVQRATADFQRAEVAYEQAILRHRQARDVGVALAQAKLSQAESQETLAKIAWDFQKTQRAADAASKRESDIVEAQYKQAQATTAAARAELEQAGIAVDMAAKDIKIAEESKKSAEELLNEAKERLKETKVLSPLDGMVVARNVQIGELVMSGKTSFTGGTVLMEIADVSEIFAEVNVDEADIGLVRQLAPESALPGTTTQMATLPEGTLEQGQKVEITVEAYPDDKFEGVIDRISPQSEILRAIATFKVWVRLVGNNHDRLKRVLNTQAQANFTAKSVRNAILVSYEAMKPDPNGTGYGVFVPEMVPGRTRPEPKFVPCKFGVDNRVDVEVIEGLKDGQDVYVQLPQKTRQEQKAEEEARQQK